MLMIAFNIYFNLVHISSLIFGTIHQNKKYGNVDVFVKCSNLESF